MKTENLKKQLLAKLESKYGKGSKNTNTDNGLYWNVKKDHRFIFFAPDYDRLIIVNNTNLSKTCYWDMMNGAIDFGGCNMNAYTKELLKNTHQKKEANDRPSVKVDKDWNFNHFVLGKTTEKEFMSSSTIQNFERVITVMAVRLRLRKYPTAIMINPFMSIFLQAKIMVKIRQPTITFRILNG